MGKLGAEGFDRLVELLVFVEAGAPARLEHEEGAAVAVLHRAGEELGLAVARRAPKVEGDPFGGRRQRGDVGAPEERRRGALGGDRPAARLHEVVEQIRARRAEPRREDIEDAIGAAGALALERRRDVLGRSSERLIAKRSRIGPGEIDERRFGRAAVLGLGGGDEHRLRGAAVTARSGSVDGRRAWRELGRRRR